MKINSMLLTDFYKFSHRVEYPQNTSKVYSTWTPRTSRIDAVDKVVAFGFQAFIKEYLIDHFNDNFFNQPQDKILKQYGDFCVYCLDDEQPDVSHIKALHDLGYLPIQIDAIEEGTLVPIRTPMLTIENTIPEFFWVVNYLETLMSSQLWIASTSATIAHRYYSIMKEAAEKSGSLDGLEWQGHDFSYRGMGSTETAILSGMGHLLSFKGTDNVPAIYGAMEYYNADIVGLAGSVTATEHSVMCANGKENEYEFYKKLITEIHPTGILSIVSDTWSFFGVIENIIKPLKDTIMQRNGKTVLRPDSGIPIDILCGTMRDVVTTDSEKKLKSIAEVLLSHKDETLIRIGEQYYLAYKLDEENGITIEKYYPTPEDLGLVRLLWNIFGGTINSKGFKELDSHIGAIYGDAITMDGCKAICDALMQLGFASTNVVFGIGSYSYQCQTRDTFGFALKATFVEVDGEGRAIYKDPKTDNGTKKSQKGMVQVGEDGSFVDGFLLKPTTNALKPLYKDGKLLRTTSFEQIRENLKGEK